MVASYTTNKVLTQPANGDDPGTWNVPVNGNMTILDNAFGGITTLALNNANVALSTAQSQNVFLSLTGALGANIAITFPGGIGGFYSIQNLCTNSSIYTVTLVTTAAGQQIGCPPSETFDIWLDGTNVKYRNFGRVGTYWDYAGSSVPAWISGCTIQPYLNCDGTSFSSATYPALANLIGTTLPDSRGRGRFTLGQGTGRMLSSAGIDGTTLFAAGGNQSVTLSSQQMPPIPYTDPGHSHAIHGYTNPVNYGNLSMFSYNQTPNYTISSAVMYNATVGITIGNASPTQVFPVPPGYVGGLTLIRAA
jgi:microcystin-dependent protein